MKTHDYLAGRKKVCHEKRPRIRIEDNKVRFPAKSSKSRALSDGAPLRPISARGGGIYLSTSGGGNSAGHLAETDAVIIPFAPAGDRDGVTIFQPFSRFAARQFQRTRPAPGQLKHAAPRFFRRAADSTAGEQITGPEIAAADSVMC